MGACQDTFLYCQQPASVFSSQQASFVRDLQASSLAKRKFQILFFQFLTSCSFPFSSLLHLNFHSLSTLSSLEDYFAPSDQSILLPNFLNITEHFPRKAYQKKTQ